MNKEVVKKIANSTGVLGLYNNLRRWYDNLTCDRFECGIGDILLLRDVPSHNQLLLTSRLMDVEDYLSGKDKSFPWQNTISYAAYGEKHKEADGNRSFKALIESYLKDGYHSDSFITCDVDMNLMDGNHRMGLHIYEKIDKVNVRRVHRKIPFEYGGDWYYHVGIHSSFMERIYQRFSDVQDWLVDSGNTFCLYLEGEETERVELIKAISHLCVVLKEIKVGFHEGTIVQFRMQNPMYYVADGKLYSERAKQIEHILNARIKGDVTVNVSMNCLESNNLIKMYVK